MTDPDALASLLFPEGDHRLQMNLRRGDAVAFLRAGDGAEAIRAQRRRQCGEVQGRYAALLPEGLPALESFRGYCAANGLPEVNDVTELAGRFDCDLLFMVRAADGVHRLAGGALCFPTGWALGDKLGRDLADIHGIVPGLNPAIGTAIHTFLSRLGPGAAFERANWGLAGSPELNRHPLAQPPGFRENPALADVWLRVEHQLLLGLPADGPLLFGIRIENVRLDALAAHPRCARGLARALRTMPGDLAAYKGIARIREGLGGQLLPG